MHTEDDTADWLGIPTPLETCRQHILLLENEIAELTRQLRESRHNVFKLVEMHDQALKERDSQSRLLTAAEERLARLEIEARDLNSTIYSLRMIEAQRNHLLREKLERDEKEFAEKNHLSRSEG